jgi:hypothetical protein
MHVQVCHFRDKSVIGIHSHTRRYTQESPVGTARHTISPPTIIKLELSSRNKDDIDGSPRVQELVTCSMGGVHHGLGPFFSFSSARGAIVRLPKIRRFDGGKTAVRRRCP